MTHKGEDGRALRERRKMFARIGLDMVEDIRLVPQEDVVRSRLRHLRGFVDTLRTAAIAKAGSVDPECMDDELRGLASLLDAQVSLLESRLPGSVL